MAEATDQIQSKVSRIKLDDETRARVAKELGFAAGIEAVPDEIAIVAVDPQDAGHEEEPEVSGYALSVRNANNVFLNPMLTPALSPDRLASAGLVSPKTMVVATVI